MMDDGEFRTKAEEKDHLTTIIKEWNASRLDMFALTFPDKVILYLCISFEEYFLSDQAI